MLTSLLILLNCIPPLLRCIRIFPLTLSVQLSNAKVNQYSQSFKFFSGKLWNSCLCLYWISNFCMT
ncbi:hypothetical protein E2C01_007142 [Portunus trituberculatus]|uniref:Uncharacterized protein n=1 Tax=Portunus trituberculatus TaxID=210409 RepID=A0A5B7CYM9_PORTR|nr:hypothetical protein [Portunus trituberculatus]